MFHVKHWEGLKLTLHQLTRYFRISHHRLTTIIEISGIQPAINRGKFKQYNESDLARVIRNYLNFAEAHNYLGISRNKLYSLIKEQHVTDYGIKTKSKHCCLFVKAELDIVYGKIQTNEIKLDSGQSAPLKMPVHDRNIRLKYNNFIKYWHMWAIEDSKKEPNLYKLGNLKEHSEKARGEWIVAGGVPAGKCFSVKRG